jgi:hypothetical protein
MVEAESKGIDVKTLALSRLMDEGSPATPAEAVAYWRREGLIGAYGEDGVDSLELSRDLRKKAETRG